MVSWTGIWLNQDLAIVKLGHLHSFTNMPYQIYYLCAFWDNGTDVFKDKSVQGVFSLDNSNSLGLVFSPPQRGFVMVRVPSCFVVSTWHCLTASHVPSCPRVVTLPACYPIIWLLFHSSHLGLVIVFSLSTSLLCLCSDFLPLIFPVFLFQCQTVVFLRYVS